MNVPTGQPATSPLVVGRWVGGQVEVEVEYSSVRQPGRGTAEHAEAQLAGVARVVDLALLRLSSTGRLPLIDGSNERRCVTAASPDTDPTLRGAVLLGLLLLYRLPSADVGLCPTIGGRSVIILVALLLIGGGVYWLTRRRAGRTAEPGVPGVSTLLAGVPAPSVGGAGRVVLSGLTKRYGELAAVDGLSFTVEPGRVTGFLGPNGAGKTTTLRVLLGLATPTMGTATIGGCRYQELDRPIRRVGAVLEGAAAHRGRTGRDHLRVICRAGGVPLERADEVLALVGLTVAGRRPFKGYSLGMRQRLGIAAALIGNPGVLILDEPANGLDPEGIRWLRDLLRGLADQGRTVLVSSHLLAEVQALADNVVIIAHGNLVAYGSVAQVLNSLARPARTVIRTPEPDKLVAELGEHAVITLGVDGDLYVSGVDVAAIGDAARRAGVSLHQVTTERPDLEDVFLELTGEAAIR
jgi:ABC-2 type transport system ATP-binding protein